MTPRCGSWVLIPRPCEGLGYGTLPAQSEKDTRDQKEPPKTKNQHRCGKPLTRTILQARLATGWALRTMNKEWERSPHRTWQAAAAKWPRTLSPGPVPNRRMIWLPAEHPPFTWNCPIFSTKKGYEKRKRVGGKQMGEESRWIFNAKMPREHLISWIILQLAEAEKYPGCGWRSRQIDLVACLIMHLWRYQSDSCAHLFWGTTCTAQPIITLPTQVSESLHSTVPQHNGKRVPSPFHPCPVLVGESGRDHLGLRSLWNCGLAHKHQTV